MLSPSPDFSHEEALMARGHGIVAGIDEAGRGPLAGPVVVAAVVLDPAALPAGLNDSKKLSPARRESLFAAVMTSAMAVSVVAVPPALILARNIRGATLWGMAEAAHSLSRAPGAALIDGRDVPPGLPCPGHALIGGDGLSLSVAAASIVAKVMRDRMCAIMDCDTPQFGFAGHKGYGTALHIEALTLHGASRHHRAGFAPVAAVLRAATEGS
ncbi:ribonuclease HII [Devosia sp.]|uniref:ribonuclease HII n=1 Tax=Devosia sp. TaxID=1871048 RepID=UPI002AFE6264|nr:ribonuclease HII [Devosia sp.]